MTAGNGHSRRPPGATAPLRAAPAADRQEQERRDLDPQAGARLLEELHAALTRYIILPSAEAADAVVLWIAATHGQPAFEHAPRLAVVSPEKRCGKSRLMDIVAETCHDPLITVNATIAAIVRALGDDPPTLLVDEADTIFGSKKAAENNEELRGLLNAGHQRNRPMLRYDITRRTNEHLATFAMAMLAGIGDLPDTIMDRAVVVRMRRRAAGEQVAPYRTRRDAHPLNTLRDRLTNWVRRQLAELEHAEPEMPLEDRAADTWEPLIAVADLAGAGWPGRARAAALALLAEQADRDDTSTGLRLLADLREVFGDADALYTTTILDRLIKLDEAPWADMHAGKPLDSRRLSARLRPYDVTSKNVREDGTGEPRKGYDRADLHEAWLRYVPLHPLHPLQDNQNPRSEAQIDVADPKSLAATSATCPGDVADVADARLSSATGLSSNDTDVADVAHIPRRSGTSLQPQPSDHGAPTDQSDPPMPGGGCWPERTPSAATPPGATRRCACGARRIAGADGWRPCWSCKTTDPPPATAPPAQGGA